MVDLDVIRKHGGTQEHLQKLFTDPNPKESVTRLIDLAASRINEGIERNLDNCRILWAIDRAYDVSQRQVTFTLVEGLISNKASDERVLQAVKDWNLDTMLVPVTKAGKVCVTSKGDPLYKLDLPTFFNIFVPVVQAYSKIRWAKLFNDRDSYPLYKYEPLKLTVKNKLKTEIITDRIQRQSSEMGYRDDEKQSILQTLLYAQCLNFPVEDWYKEEQLVMADGKERKTTIREGVRFAIPHPSRCAIDLMHRPATINSDTGCEWAFYWDIVRYGALADNKHYWNTGQVDAAYGKYGWPRNTKWTLYQELFPCRMKFPSIATDTRGAGDQDRISKAVWYTREQYDEAVTVVPLFMKIVPKEFDLYDYEYPVWHRFVFAAERSVIHAMPLAYTPCVLYQYDADQNRAFNTSLALELLPWQDHLGNYLTQYLLSIKKNLEKVVFWNPDILNQEDIDRIQNLGETLYRNTVFIPASKRELGYQQTSTREAFWPVQFPHLPTQEISGAVNTMLFMLERMLGFAAQEVGAAATHEQSLGEVQIIQQNTGVRLQFTGSGIDSGIRAKKQLLYDAMMAYSSDEVFAEVADVNDVRKEALKEMGFKIEEEQEGNGAKAGVKGSKKSLKLDGFASEREGVDRIQDGKVAAAMIQTFQIMFSNQAIVQAVGIPQLIDLFNQMLVFAGLPKDFRLKFDESKMPGLNPEQQQAEQAAQAEQAKAQLAAMQQLAAETSQQVVRNEIAQMAQALQRDGLDPLRSSIQQLTALQSEMAGKNAAQDQVLARILSVLNTAAAVSAPQPVPPDAPLPIGTTA